VASAGIDVTLVGWGPQVGGWAFVRCLC
jgi:hypothetical protein